jgi:Glycosyl transferase family 2
VHYLLPLKAGPGDDLAELGRYVRGLTAQLPVIVVDGSDPTTFAANAVRFAGAVHLAPSDEFACANGKVAGVLTGFAACPSDVVVVADDDVRYEPAELTRLAALLERADVVIPQNHYRPMTAPAWWDTARILLNRALPSGDYPGTLGVRLTRRLRELGYDGDVLFENLELIRTVVADGGTAVVARDLYVRREPPPTNHFVGQRVRQAYDSLAQPARLAFELALLPTLLLGGRGGRAVLIGGGVLVAEIGRRRAGGRDYFPAGAALLAPGWLVERAVCSWIAVGRRMFRGGTPYAGRRITRAANSVATLRRRRG